MGDEERAHECAHELHDEGALEGPCPTRSQERRRRREEPERKPYEERSREEVHFVQPFQRLAATDECEHFEVVNSDETRRLSQVSVPSSYSFDGVDEDNNAMTNNAKVNSSAWETLPSYVAQLRPLCKIRERTHKRAY